MRWLAAVFFSLLVGCSTIGVKGKSGCAQISTVSEIRASPPSYEGKVVCIRGYFSSNFEFQGIYEERDLAGAFDTADVIQIRGLPKDQRRKRVGVKMVVLGRVHHMAECWNDLPDKNGMITGCIPIKRPVYLDDVQLLSQ